MAELATIWLLIGDFGDYLANKLKVKSQKLNPGSILIGDSPVQINSVINLTYNFTLAKIQNQMEYLGNKEILKNYKTGFLCSRKVPANIILKTYDWAIEQREKGVCVVSGFHSKIEKDVFDILMKGTQPIILVLARSMFKKIRPDLAKLVDQNRLLIISAFDKKNVRPTTKTAWERNNLIAEISDKLFIPYATPTGSVYQIKNSFAGKIIPFN